MLPRDLLSATTVGLDGCVVFPSSVMQQYFASVVPPRLRSPATNYVLTAIMHAAVQGLNHRYLSRQSLVVGLHAGNADMLMMALRRIRPDFALHLLPNGADAPMQIAHLAKGHRRVEALLCLPGVAAADRRAARDAAGDACQLQVFADPDAEDAAAGATLWRAAPDGPTSIGLIT